MRAIRWLIPLLVMGFIAYGIRAGYHNWVRTEPMPTLTQDPGRIRLEVVNASGDLGAGRDVREYLARKGFDVYDDRNYDEIIPRTRVVDRRDRGLGFAREVQKVLTVPARRVGPFSVSPRLQPEIAGKVDSMLLLEASVMLGADYRTFCPITPRPF